MTSPSLSPVPTPAELALRQQTLLLDCIPCGRATRHIMGRATYGLDAELLVQWWTCTACSEGETIA